MGVSWYFTATGLHAVQGGTAKDGPILLQTREISGCPWYRKITTRLGDRQAEKFGVIVTLLLANSFYLRFPSATFREFAL